MKELADLGILSRRSDDSDARLALMVLTDRGRCLVEDAGRILVSLEDELADRIGADAVDAARRSRVRLGPFSCGHGDSSEPARFRSSTERLTSAANVVAGRPRTSPIAAVTTSAVTASQTDVEDGLDQRLGNRDAEVADDVAHVAGNGGRFVADGSSGGIGPDRSSITVGGAGVQLKTSMVSTKRVSRLVR